MKKSYLSLVFVVFAISLGLSQKYAYLNSTQLLLDMPEVKAADSELEAYQKSLLAKGEEMLKTLEVNYNLYVEEAQAGNLTGLQVQQKESALAQEQQNIQKYEQEVQQLIGQKREELYKPILDKVKNIVQQIGKEGSYTMIFDTSNGGMVFADEGQNVMSLVKSKLGI